MSEQIVEQIDRTVGSPRRGGLGRAVYLLTGCQFLYSMGISVDLTLTALAGLMLAPSLALATAPLTVMMTTTMVGGFGTGLLSARFGSRAVLSAGALLAVLGGLICAWAMWAGSFVGLCLGTALVGLYKATGGYFRYLAADHAMPGRQEMAISAVLCGGVMAALIGPATATWAGGLLAVPFAGAYVLGAILALCVIPLVLFVGTGARAAATVDDEPAPPAPSPLPLRAAVVDANFRLALLLLSVSGGVMTMLMAAAPIASMHAGHSAHQGAVMIQWHMVGMFAPSLVSGRLVSAWGLPRAALVGLAVLTAGAVMGASGTAAGQLTSSLLLVGVGWNVLLVAGTGYAVRCYRPGAGGRVQAVVEGVSGLVIALASLAASWAFANLGWHRTNLAATALCLATVPLTVILVRRGGHAHTAGPTHGSSS
jgi:MFS family permease